jgi:RNA polymerase sigma factor (sigma-70 family)
MVEDRNQNINNIIAQNSNRLLSFIRSRVRNTSDAEDILQDVWSQLNGIVDLGGIEQVSSWLFRVARNRITDDYRKKKPDLILDDTERDENPGSLVDLMAEMPAFEDEEMKEVFWDHLFDALDELPENQKNAFVWNELEDLTFQEIADKTGEGIKTWISRKGYAVKHLRNRLQSIYVEFFDNE